MPRFIEHYEWLSYSLIMDWDPGLFGVLENGPQLRVMKGDDSFSRVDRVQTRRYQRRSFCAREREEKGQCDQQQQVKQLSTA